MSDNTQLDIYQVLQIQVKNPSGHDPHIAHFFQAVLQLDKKDGTFTKLLEKVKEERKRRKSLISNTHLVTLLLRAIQYIALYKNGQYENIQYINSIHTPEQWQKLIEDILANHKELLWELLVSKEVGTNIPSRYAGIAALLHILHPHKPMNIVDLGCSIDQGLKTMVQVNNNQIQFEPIIDHTPDHIVARYMNEPLPYNVTVGMDKIDFQNKEGIEWLLACSHYPKDLHTLPKNRERLMKLADTPHTPIIIGDLVNVDDYFPPSSFDVAILSSVLYQFLPEEQNVIIQKVMNILTEDGLLFIQDTAQKERDSLVFQYSFGTPYSYRLYIYGNQTGRKFYEVFQYKDNRCTEVKPGADFDLIKKLR